MIATVPGRAVLMGPTACGAGQELIDGRENVEVAPGSGLEDGDPGCRMRDEDGQKTIAFPRTEVVDLTGEVDYRRFRSGSYCQFD